MLTYEVESHNRVSWSFKRDYVWVWLGLLIAMVAVILLMAFSPAEPRLRNAIIATAIVICLGTAIWLAVASPNYVQGTMDRQPDTGDMQIERRWLPFLDPSVQNVSLNAIESFLLEAVVYERAAGHLFTLARLWAVSDDENVLVCDWADPEDVDAFGQALAKAARKPYAGTDVATEGEGR